ncbi:sugar phosphate isomerase/epimerase [Chloroflexi bacterium TSY]|nr:sugar phosphate isomerase/epimerase [Chloroflexi bacterium TSY]
MTTPKLALQLYTLRDALAMDYPGVLRRVAEIGYTHVETAFLPEHMTVHQAAQMVRDAGLTVCSAHVEIPLGDKQAGVLAVAEAYDCTTIIWHGWPQAPDYGSIEGVKRLAELYNQANAVAQANGLQFGLHNHWWECAPLVDKAPYQILLDLLDPSIFFEVDTYWATTAGRNPLQMIRELGARTQFLHIKDGPAIHDEPMTAVGAGQLNFHAIAQASNDHAKWWVVEMDECATDMLEAVEQSFRFLTESGLAY